MSSETINSRVDERGVATVTLNNPAKHNAFDDRMIADLSRCFSELGTSNQVRVVILAATGRSFSAGADLGWMQRMANFSFEENLADAENLAAMLHTLNSLNKPTIARVQGTAFGGGVGLISCCDMAIASERASFCLSEVKLGMVPATISPYVIAAIGPRAARRYFVTAERFDAATALHIGLICECVAEEQLDSCINNIVSAILNNGPAAVASAKQLIRDVRFQPIDAELMQQTSELIASIRSSSEAKEGLSAFLEKRPARWTSSADEEEQ